MSVLSLSFILGKDKKSDPVNTTLWEDVVANPKQWWDCRTAKINRMVRTSYLRTWTSSLCSIYMQLAFCYSFASLMPNILTLCTKAWEGVYGLGMPPSGFWKKFVNSSLKKLRSTRNNSWAKVILILNSESNMFSIDVGSICII